jgi:hypothetical protein
MAHAKPNLQKHIRKVLFRGPKQIISSFLTPSQLKLVAEATLPVGLQTNVQHARYHGNADDSKCNTIIDTFNRFRNKHQLTQTDKLLSGCLESPMVNVFMSIKMPIIDEQTFRVSQMLTYYDKDDGTKEWPKRISAVNMYMENEDIQLAQANELNFGDFVFAKRHLCFTDSHNPNPLVRDGQILKPETYALLTDKQQLFVRDIGSAFDTAVREDSREPWKTALGYAAKWIKNNGSP